MARERGPKTKISRRFQESLFGPDKYQERKNYPPGQHGNARRRGKESDYSVQLKEKQKAKHTYGILERQFAKMFDIASRKKGITGENLLQLCECRLDNTIYRLGVAPTRRGARQLVTHGHITVNGTVVNIPSFNVRVGDEVSVRERSRTLEAVTNSLANVVERGEWLEWDGEKMTGKMISIPERAQIKENIKEQLIVELYSK